MFADSTFYMRYALDGIIEGRWSDEMTLHAPPAGQQFNYAGHAYPSFDPSGKTLLLSWTFEGNFTRMARVVFE